MCTFEQIQKANATICTTAIQGKEYAEVNQRIKAFRMIHPNGSITTELLSLENGVCIFRAIIRDAENKLLGTGTAYEKEGSTFINKTSYIENCETSAVGRALAMCGFGIDTSIASSEEVQNAMANQQPEKPKKATKKAEPKKNTKAEEKPKEEPQSPLNKLSLLLKANNVTEKEACTSLQIANLNELKDSQATYVVDHFSTLLEAVERRRANAS